MTPQSLVEDFLGLPKNDLGRLGMAALISHEFCHVRSLAAALAKWAPSSEVSAPEDWIHILTTVPATRITITPGSDFAPSHRKVAQLNLIHGGLEVRSPYLHTFDSGQEFIYFDSACAKAIATSGKAASLLAGEEAQLALDCLSYRGGDLSPRMVLTLAVLDKQEPPLSRLLEASKRSLRLYNGRIPFDQRIRGLLQHLLSDAFTERFWYSFPETAIFQLLFAQCWELQSLDYFLGRGNIATHGATHCGWYALLKKYAAAARVVDLTSGPVRRCAYNWQPYAQYGGAIGTRAMFGPTTPPGCELAVFDPAGIRGLQSEASTNGMLHGLAWIRFGYFKAMVCEQQLQPASKEYEALWKAIALGSFDNEGTDELISKEYVRRSKGWPICSF